MVFRKFISNRNEKNVNKDEYVNILRISNISIKENKNV